ncbi:phosphotransferase family protein [Kribbella sp. NPDC058245]|uniref:phosphotransferase family protein n=1 Tax=Kribbella sp. NPDC058245 TaxID=3346399 RepID=UPI0036EE7042
MDTTESVVAELNVALGTDYTLVRRLTGGLQSGAFELTDGAVLKWTDNPDWSPRVHRAADLVRRARAVGYPTPEWLAVGTTTAGSPYQLQAFVPGTPIRGATLVDESLARQLIAACELQRDLVPEDIVNWSGYAHGVVFEGWEDDLWERVRGYGGEVTDLINRYDALCRPHRDHPLPTNDLVHGDLNLGNLLVEDGLLTGIIDFEAAGSGSRVYDLISLAASAARDGAPPGIDELFVEAALQAGGHATAAVCAASIYASVAEFAHRRSPVMEELVAVGARRVVDLLDG